MSANEHPGACRRISASVLACQPAFEGGGVAFLRRRARAPQALTLSDIGGIIASA
jgi:hypothetical protein